MVESVEEHVRKQVEALRLKLLDLSLRNRMLNYKPSKRLGVTLVGAAAHRMHAALVTEARKVILRGQARGDGTTGADEAEPEFEDRSSDDREQTPDAIEDAATAATNGRRRIEFFVEDTEELLQSKLRIIQREAQLANDELGINTLFLTLGMLEWCDTDNRTYRAPLLFVPVKLERQANASIRLVHDGSDVGGNLPLRAKLAELALKVPEFDDERPIEDYFFGVETTIKRQQDWAVHPDEICLGFFNYEKYAMYQDLGGDAWPDPRKPWLHEDMIALLGGSGYATGDDPLEGVSFYDDIRPVAEAHEVYDADSSQTVAMIRASSGASIVIEGPPGTGKSQTITNIIAEAVAAGKRVLFVAAKRAAVDVVKRRLDEAGLGAMCLDIHDKLANRRAFYAEIKATLDRSLSVRTEETKLARLEELRGRLTAHSRAANESIADHGSISPFQAMARMARLPKETDEDRVGRIPFAKLSHLTHEDVLSARRLVRSLQARLSVVGVPQAHAFWGASIAYLDPATRFDLESGLSDAIEACASAATSLSKVATALCIDVPPTADDVRVLRVCAERALSAPSLDGVALRTSTWNSCEGVIRGAIAQLQKRSAIRGRWVGQVSDDVWRTDLAGAHQSYERLSARWYRMLSGDFRSARRQVRGLMTSHKSSPADELQMLRDALAVRETEKELAEADAQMHTLFGVQWNGVDSDPQVIRRLFDWVLALRIDMASGVLPSGLLDFLSGEHSDAGLVEAVAQAEQDAERAIEKYAEMARLLEYVEHASRAEPWSTLIGRLTAWSRALPQLPAYIAYVDARRNAVDNRLECVVDLADRWELAADRLCDAFLRSYYTGLLRKAIDERAPLRSFERVQHEEAISEFRALDDFGLKYNRVRVRLAHLKTLPSFDRAAGNLQILKVQCELQQSHKPIRWIMERAGEAIQRAKPVFMMSPLSVAVHLPPKLPPFDIVIFDEASQIKPEDALCSIIRGRQIVVVGDTRQMPPTTFFDRVLQDGDADEDEPESAEFGLEARKLESILNLMSTAVSA